MWSGQSFLLSVFPDFLFWRFHYYPEISPGQRADIPVWWICSISVSAAEIMASSLVFSKTGNEILFLNINITTFYVILYTVTIWINLRSSIMLFFYYTFFFYYVPVWLYFKYLALNVFKCLIFVLCFRLQIHMLSV